MNKYQAVLLHKDHLSSLSLSYIHLSLPLVLFASCISGRWLRVDCWELVVLRNWYIKTPCLKTVQTRKSRVFIKYRMGAGCLCVIKNITLLDLGSILILNLNLFSSSGQRSIDYDNKSGFFFCLTVCRNDYLTLTAWKGKKSKPAHIKMTFKLFQNHSLIR